MSSNLPIRSPLPHGLKEQQMLDPTSLSQAIVDWITTA